jgi:hypothetical protein
MVTEVKCHTKASSNPRTTLKLKSKAESKNIESDYAVEFKYAVVLDNAVELGPPLKPEQPKSDTILDSNEHC